MRILYVEDHATFANTVIAGFLADHQVERVASIAEAQERCWESPPRRDRRHEYDVYLVDFDLPDGKGSEFVRELRGAGELVPVIAASAHEHGNAMLLDAGANYVCAKSAFAGIGALLASARALPERSALARPRPDALAAVVAAKTPSLPTDGAAAMEKLLESVLFEDRHYWRKFLKVLITHTEVRNLLLADVDHLVERLTGCRPDFTERHLTLTTRFEDVLFRTN